ncbi:hypothetical protein EVAR_46546_1 [Eumeta japonica]|uniref:BED-type domain-containing protein n=1 Tax=Eumeta variegata TaxID=151549 RepID=A0A4C1XQV1_EUMVA|nr:hypothetical protein EVAR_46546_1 [Eumeta japonica]
MRDEPIWFKLTAIPNFVSSLTLVLNPGSCAAALSLLLGRVGRRSEREVARSALSLARSAQAERDNESCFFRPADRSCRLTNDPGLVWSREYVNRTDVRRRLLDVMSTSWRRRLTRFEFPESVGSTPLTRHRSEKWAVTFSVELLLVAKDGNSAKCKRCPSILKTLGGSTKGLHTHLSTKHNIKVISASTSQDTENLNTAPPPAKRKLDDYFTKTKSDDDNLDDVLARMIALDGFPFSVFITSDNLRKLLLAKYTDLPKSAVTIQNAL